MVPPAEVERLAVELGIARGEVENMGELDDEAFTLALKVL